MAEYIEREALLHEMKMDVRPPFAVVRDFPAADVVEVMRCGKCLLGTPSNLNGMIHCKNNNMEHRPDCYCSYGERKEG